MMSLETIHNLAHDQGVTAQQAGTEPHLIQFADEIDDYPPFPFPNIGSYHPGGWSEVGDPAFVDSSGMGAPDEPSMTVDQLKAWLEPGYGYAIVSEGQFQIYIGKFRPDPATLERITIDGGWSEFLRTYNVAEYELRTRSTPECDINEN